jgi:hypothetical protein
MVSSGSSGPSLSSSGSACRRPKGRYLPELDDVAAGTMGVCTVTWAARGSAADDLPAVSVEGSQ